MDYEEQVKNCILLYIGIGDLVHLVVQFVDPLLSLLSVTGPDELLKMQQQETRELLELQTIVKKGIAGQRFNSINDLIVVSFYRSRPFQKVTTDRMQDYLIDQGWRVITGSTFYSSMEYWILVHPNRTQPISTQEIRNKINTYRLFDSNRNHAEEIQWSSPIDQ